MLNPMLIILSVFVFLSTSCQLNEQGTSHPIESELTTAQTIGAIPAPKGYSRTEASQFGSWLRKIALHQPNKKVLLHNGQQLPDQSGVYRVINKPVGNKDLKQCADAIIALKAEYLLDTDRVSDIAFNLTSGDRIHFQEWLNGKIPVVKGNKVGYKQVERMQHKKRAFDKYLQFIYMYAGTHSLSKELKKKDINEMEIGDVFIKGGFPGHAMIVMDLVENESGDKKFMLAQSFMPAQEMHVVKNPADKNGSPWFEMPSQTKSLMTPGWTFASNQLMTWYN